MKMDETIDHAYMLYWWILNTALQGISWALIIAWDTYAYATWKLLVLHAKLIKDTNSFT